MKISPGCAHCYAATDTFARRERSRGIELWGVDAARHVTSDAYWRQPLAWNRKAVADGVWRRVFCGSLCDVFEDRDDLRVPRARLWQLIGQTPHLDWLLLTKRPENARRLWDLAARVTREEDAVPDWWPHVWLGTTAEDQQRADERIPHLLAVPAAVRFVSAEPMLGPVDFSPWLGRCTCSDCGGSGEGPDRIDGPGDVYQDPCRHCDGRGTLDADGRVSWVIVGGESGPRARPFDLTWARSAVEQTKAAGVACFVKQMGSNPITMEHLVCAGCSPDGALCSGHFSGRRVPLNHRSGADPAEWPDELRVRQFPEPRP